MKKSAIIFSVAFLFSFATTGKFARAFFISNWSQEYFDVRIQNDCDHDVKLRIEAFGSSSETTISKNSYESRPVQPGYKLYADGVFFKEIKAADRGVTLIVCK